MDHTRSTLILCELADIAGISTDAQPDQIGNGLRPLIEAARKLPKTKDGVPCAYGTFVWNPYDLSHQYVFRSGHRAVRRRGPYKSGPYVSSCYFDRAAAEAAKKEGQ